MTKNIYALLVGISRFAHPKIHPLAGCADDVEKMGKYLQTLESNSTKVHIKKLMDSAATREAMINNFREHGKKAGKDDIFLFYFSSHGVEEHADKVWWNVSPSKKLQSLICYDAFHHGVYPIADKEQRFLIKEVYDKANCEIVMLFDCCHSGDNTRAVELDNEQNVKMLENVESKSLFTAPARNWSKFLFSDKFEKDEFSALSDVNDKLPQAPHTAISACSAYEPAYIVNGKSLFTHAFLDVMSQARGDVSYYNLHSRIMNNLRGKQTPRLYTFPSAGNRTFRSFLFGAAMDKQVFGSIVYQRELSEWSIDLGAIHGVKPTSETGQSIIVNLSDSETCTAEIKEVFPGHSVLEMEAYANYSKADLGGYQGFIANLISKPTYISFHGESDGAKKGQDYYTSKKETLVGFNIFDVAVPDSIHLEIHAVDGSFELYTANKGEKLGYSFSGYSDESMNKIIENVKKYSSWQYTRDLENESPKIFNDDIIEVTVTQGDKEIPLKDGMYTLDFNRPTRQGKVKSGNCEIKFTNKGRHKIEMAGLYLSDDFAIDLRLMSQRITPLEKDDFVFALDGSSIPFHLDALDVQMNKKELVMTVKCIYSNSHFSVDMFEQSGMRSGSQTKGFDLSSPDEEEVPLDWGTKLVKLVVPIANDSFLG
ncbi:MAG: caspase family protein [Bacteroidota bacterium]